MSTSSSETGAERVDAPDGRACESGDSQAPTEVWLLGDRGAVAAARASSRVRGLSTACPRRSPDCDMTRTVTDEADPRESASTCRRWRHNAHDPASGTHLSGCVKLFRRLALLGKAGDSSTVSTPASPWLWLQTSLLVAVIAMAFTALALYLPPGYLTIIALVGGGAFFWTYLRNPALWLVRLASLFAGTAIALALAPTVKGYVNLGPLGSFFVNTEGSIWVTVAFITVALGCAALEVWHRLHSAEKSVEIDTPRQVVSQPQASTTGSGPAIGSIIGPVSFNHYHGPIEALGSLGRDLQSEGSQAPVSESGKILKDSYSPPEPVVGVAESWIRDLQQAISDYLTTGTVSEALPGTLQRALEKLSEIDRSTSRTDAAFVALGRSVETSLDALTRFPITEESFEDDLYLAAAFFRVLAPGIGKTVEARLVSRREMLSKAYLASPTPTSARRAVRLADLVNDPNDRVLTMVQEQELGGDPAKWTKQQCELALAVGIALVARGRWNAARKVYRGLWSVIDLQAGDLYRLGKSYAYSDGEPLDHSDPTPGYFLLRAYRKDRKVAGLCQFFAGFLDARGMRKEAAMVSLLVDLPDSFEPFRLPVEGTKDDGSRRIGQVNLIALGSGLVFTGRIMTQHRANWSVEVSEFIVGELKDLVAYCTRLPALTDRFVVVSALLEAYPVEGIARWSRVGEAIHLEIQVGEPFSAHDASNANDLDFSQLSSYGDIATISGAPMVQRILERLVGWAPSSIWEGSILSLWLGRSVRHEDGYTDEMIRLAVTLICRAPSHREAGTSNISPVTHFIAKVVAVEPGVVSSRDGSKFCRTRVSVLVGGVAGTQSWDLDVRL